MNGGPFYLFFISDSYSFFLLTPSFSVPFVLYSSGHHIILGPSAKAQPNGSLKLRMTQIDSSHLYVPFDTWLSIIFK